VCRYRLGQAEDKYLSEDDAFITAIQSFTKQMQENSLRTVKEHWAQILTCDPSEILSDGVTVTQWGNGSVEFLVWDGGAVIGAPERLQSPLRQRIGQIPFDLSGDDARQFVAPIANVEGVLGPQFVGYCDQAAFDPANSDAQQIKPDRLKPLCDDCPEDEWTRSAIQLNGVDHPTFAVFRDGQPIAASQISSAHGVAGFATITHPEYRNSGHGKSVVSRAMEVAFEQNLLPEYRTVEHWSSSVALAEHLGFECVARSILVQLPETE
jgi:GNAT superfamily N-acetyltransferase